MAHIDFPEVFTDFRAHAEDIGAEVSIAAHAEYSDGSFSSFYTQPTRPFVGASLLKKFAVHAALVLGEKRFLDNQDGVEHANELLRGGGSLYDFLVDHCEGPAGAQRVLDAHFPGVVIDNYDEDGEPTQGDKLTTAYSEFSFFYRLHHDILHPNQHVLAEGLSNRNFIGPDDEEGLVLPDILCDRPELALYASRGWLLYPEEHDFFVNHVSGHVVDPESETSLTLSVLTQGTKESPEGITTEQLTRVSRNLITVWSGAP